MIEVLRRLPASLLGHWPLIFQLTKRDVLGRYRESVMGIVWSFINPLVMLLVYTFVFSVVFQARGAGMHHGKTGFALWLFVGMIVHGLFAETVNRSPNLILSRVNYVKKVVFPLEVLNWVAMGSTLFHTGISLLVWMAFYLLVEHTLHWTVILVPLVFFPLILVTMGIGWFLSATGVYLRDIGQMTWMVTMVLLFLSPVFYSIEALPASIRPWLYVNPLTFIIEQARRVLLDGTMPDWGGWLIYLAASVLVAALGLAWFQKTRKGFADVI